jgi:hypothetical protein
MKGSHDRGNLQCKSQNAFKSPGAPCLKGFQNPKKNRSRRGGVNSLFSEPFIGETGWAVNVILSRLHQNLLGIKATRGWEILR